MDLDTSRPKGQPSLVDREIDSFFYNKSLQQEGAEWRAGELVADLRGDIRLVGKALVLQQERAIQERRTETAKLVGAIDGQRADAADNARKLQATVEDAAANLSAGLEGTRGAIAGMADAICDQLTNVRWQLAQQGDTLKGILDVLKHSRSNECRQLVHQGERNLEATLYAEAKDRFTLALQQDNTDYLVHQNLGLVHVRLGEFDAARQHFERAALFAPKDNRLLRAVANTHVARVHYATGAHAAAERALVQALNDDPSSAKNWYDLGVVRAATENASGTTEAIRRAIVLDRTYFAMAAADAELRRVRPFVDQLLVALTADADAALQAQWLSFTALTSALPAMETVVGSARASADAIQKIPQLVSSSRTRGTFARLWAAHDTVKQTIGEIERQTLASIDAHIASVKTAVAAEDRAKASRVQTITSAHDTKVGAVRVRASADVERAGCAAQLAVFVIAFGGLAVGGMSLGLGGGVPVVSMFIAIALAWVFPHLWSAITRSTATASEGKLARARAMDVAAAEQRSHAASDSLRAKLAEAERIRSAFVSRPRR